RPSRTPLFVLGGLVLIALVFGIQRWRWGLNHVATDDAQVEGHVVPTLARVAGYVTEVDASENQRVAAGQLLVRLDDHEFAARLAQAEADLRQALAIAGTRPEDGWGGGHVGQAEAQIEASPAAGAHARANAARAPR